MSKLIQYFNINRTQTTIHEPLNLRAQRDYNLNVLNDSNTHINKNAKTIIDEN